jgi:hypothetical protein
LKLRAHLNFIMDVIMAAASTTSLRHGNEASQEFLGRRDWGYGDLSRCRATLENLYDDARDARSGL